MPRHLIELWPSNNRFCCKKCITGPASDWAANIAYYTCLVGILTPYYIFVAPRIWDDISPIIPIAISLSSLLSLLFFLLTSFTDPGIIPRRAFLML